LALTDFKIESWQIRSENSKGYHAIPFVSDLKLIDKISPFLPLDLAGSKKSRGSKDGQDEVRSSRSNSKRIDDIRKSKRSGRASQSIRREKTDSEVELGNVPPPERLRDSKSAENTTSDSKDSEEKGKAHEEGVPTVEVKHYGATVGIETFFETLNALVSHAKGTTAFISDCFSREYATLFPLLPLFTLSVGFWGTYRSMKSRLSWLPPRWALGSWDTMRWVSPRTP
jgi:hypothetical protein